MLVGSSTTSALPSLCVPRNIEFVSCNVRSSLEHSVTVTECSSEERDNYREIDGTLSNRLTA